MRMRTMPRSVVGILAIALLLAATGCTQAPPASTPQDLSGIAGWQGSAPKSAEAFSFVVMSDRTGGAMAGAWELAVEKANLLAPDFVMCVGDLVEGYTDDPNRWRAMWNEVDRLNSKLNAPFFYCVGNHDVTGAKDGAWQVGQFVDRHGVDGRSYYSFNYRRCHFVVLDSPTMSQDANFAQAQLDWLAKNIAASSDAKHVFVFSHYPCVEMGDKKYWPRMAGILPPGKTTVFNGHWHDLHYRKVDGFTVYTLPATATKEEPKAGRSLMNVTVAGDGSPRVALLLVDAIRSEADIEDLESQQRLSALATMSPLPPEGGTVVVRQQNPLAVPVSLSLKWDVSGWDVSPREGKLKVEANSTGDMAFTFKPPAGATGAGASRSAKLTTDTAFVGAANKGLRRTDVLDLPISKVTSVAGIAKSAGLDGLRDTLTNLPPRIIRAGDANVAELRLAVAGDTLAMHARVYDARCTRDAKEWKGAAFELYVSQPLSTLVHQLVFSPTSPAGGKVSAYRSGQEQPEPNFTWRVVPIAPYGYEIEAIIPADALGLEPNVEQFLLDAAVTAAAKSGEKPKFSLLYTGDPRRSAYRNSRYFGLANVQAP